MNPDLTRLTFEIWFQIKEVAGVRMTFIQIERKYALRKQFGSANKIICLIYSWQNVLLDQQNFFVEFLVSLNQIIL